MPRLDGRAPDQLRQIAIIPGAAPYAEGSALIEVGSTRVLCAATVEEGVPSWLRGQGRGWITGEYALLPRATQTRNRRERNGPGGRTQEIQRLIGRALRAAVDLTTLGEYTITIDCDVLQADGGTRTASITGGYVALALAIAHIQQQGWLKHNPIRYAVAAVSAGIIDGEALLDLNYEEDSRADVDCNIVQIETGDLVEVQATAEGAALTPDQFSRLLVLTSAGIRELLAIQRTAVASARG
ncbi:MAG: ribonuclease PH [Chloroflexaceae bacterium]|nr:ribonuclease PH [Chloroflexaceae bacterium]NJL33892.1 ribonuclease PH [Chloroflexaceae bacterium]NJO05381.1 ribonuclease PH [Chloroflexaceae bacterium]